MYQFNDGICPGGRRPRLYLAKGGEVVKFKGHEIDGYCAVATAQYKQAGKWSSTTYQLAFVPGVRPLYFLSPMHGAWGDNLGSWGEVVEALGLPIEIARRVVRAEYKATAERLDKLEAFGAETEADEMVVVSFGSPTNRATQEGYWAAEKRGHTSGGREVIVAPGKGGDWLNPTVIEPEGAKVISSRHTPGRHGGYYSVEVVVPATA
jgi:hypothetical protein